MLGITVTYSISFKNKTALSLMTGDIVLENTYCECLTVVLPELLFST